MASYLPVISLLVLLILSSPGVDAVPTQRLCGAHLVTGLYLVCGDDGFFYSPKTKRDMHNLHGLLSRKSSQDDDEVGPSLGGSLTRRSIEEQCCHRPGSIFDLQNYCN